MWRLECAVQLNRCLGALGWRLWKTAPVRLFYTCYNQRAGHFLTGPHLDQDGFSSIDTDNSHFHSLKKAVRFTMFGAPITVCLQSLQCPTLQDSTRSISGEVIGRLGFWGGTPSENYRKPDHNYQGNLKHGGYSGTRYRDRPLENRKRSYPSE